MRFGIFVLSAKKSRSLRGRGKGNRDLRSENENKIEYEYDFQISNQSLIPRTLALSRCLPADKETLETRLV